MNLVKFARIPIAITVIAVVAAGIIGGIETALIVALLGVLEISISFDNAVVNASVLHKMSEKWQRVFLTWGILIAVFGMRLVFPIVIVAVAAGLGIGEVLDQALNEPDVYADNLEDANPIIASFGGMFLLLVFLGFFLDDDKEDSWFGPVERPLAKVGRIEAISVGIAGLTLFIVSQIVAREHREEVLAAGLAGIVIHIFVSNIADLLEPDDDEEQAVDASGNVVGLVGKAGFASFMYLEVLDASFSFDGVIGAFAISKDIIVIAVGLGLGAFYIRTLTVYLVRAGTLKQYVYLEHGAHRAIGSLAVLLLIGIEHHVPEVITGLVGAGLIGAALASSVAYNRNHRDGGGSGGDGPVGDPDHKSLEPV